MCLSHQYENQKQICNIFLIAVGSNSNYPDVPPSPPAEGTYEEDWEVFDP